MTDRNDQPPDDDERRRAMERRLESKRVSMTREAFVTKLLDEEHRSKSVRRYVPPPRRTS